MNCPSCGIAVQVEWHECRRCGTRLPLDLREPIGTSSRVPPLPRRPPVAITGRNPVAAPPMPSIPDTLLPGRTLPAADRPDTIVPPAVANSRTNASIAAIRTTVERLKRRFHR